MRVAHICLYPELGQKHASDSGVASYTKNLLANMPRDDTTSHTVLCSRSGRASSHFRDGRILVMRCFDRNWRFAKQLHAQLKKLNPDVVHIQHELSLFGGLTTAFLLPLLILPWRRRLTITLHGVVDLGQVNKGFVRSNGYSPAPVWLVRLGLMILYWPLAHWPQRIVVHEPYFKHRLVGQYGADGSKVAVIAHGVEDFSQMPKKAARQKLGLAGDFKVVLFMGYAAGYKGIDQLIEGFAEYANNQPKAYLLVGAGAHPKFKNDAAYQVVYEGYKRKARRLIPGDQYRWVGFITETDVATYYSAADVSVYPYTAALASSGPMAFAIGFSQPFLASAAFAGIFNNQLIFDSKPEALAQKLSEFFGDTRRFDGHIARLRAERLWQHSSLKTIELYKQIG